MNSLRGVLRLHQGNTCIGARISLPIWPSESPRGLFRDWLWRSAMSSPSRYASGSSVWLSSQGHTGPTPPGTTLVGVMPSSEGCGASTKGREGRQDLHGVMVRVLAPPSCQPRSPQAPWAVAGAAWRPVSMEET